MIRKHFKKLFALLLILTLFTIAFNGCKRNNNEDEGGKGNSTSDGTDGSVDENKEPMEGTDTSDASGNGNDMNGDEIQTEAVGVKVISEAEIRALAIGKMGNVTVDTIYNMDYQNEVYNQLEILKQNNEYSLESPLFVLNPYGTNRSSMYVFLNTEAKANLEYTISVDDERIPDFTRHLYTNEDLDPLMEHEGIITGLIPGMVNTITIRSFDGNSNITSKKIYTVEVPDYGTVTDIVIDVTQKLSLEELSSGLYCILGYNRGSDDEPRHILFYDNSGVLRGEIPIYVKEADVRIEFVDDHMIYPCTDNQFALVNKAGRVVNVYTLDGYSIHHDFDYDDDEDRLVILATNQSSNTKEDSVVALDLESGNYTELFNFTTLFPDIVKKTQGNTTNGTKDTSSTNTQGTGTTGHGTGWLQLNSIQIHDTDNIIVSSRELSSIIQVSDIFEKPVIDYIIAEPAIWQGTGYENYLLSQSGNFTNHAGQYNVMYMDDDTLEDDQYYLHFYNSNYGYSESYPDIDYSSIKGVGNESTDADHSFYYKYLVDEDAGTYELVDSIAVPYSKIGSTQDIDGNHLITSGTAGIFAEYDTNGNLIAQYNLKLADGAYVYRVFKYKMNGHWYN